MPRVSAKIFRTPKGCPMLIVFALFPPRLRGSDPSEDPWMDMRTLLGGAGRRLRARKPSLSTCSSRETAARESTTGQWTQRGYLL
mmetsp:Transcript_15832/g.39027  ORF Transcript_15832/g.39027 Transcript_15832/m.39027 type:complete len:85 (-) Transcript_15832:1930-2184(-)